MPLWALIYSQTASPATDFTPWMVALTNFGGFGLLLILLLTNRVYTAKAYDDRTKERDKALDLAAAATQRADKADDTIRQFTQQAEITNRLLEGIKSGSQGTH